MARTTKTVETRGLRWELRLWWTDRLIARRARLHKRVRKLLAQSDACGVLIDRHIAELQRSDEA